MVGGSAPALGCMECLNFVDSRFRCVGRNRILSERADLSGKMPRLLGVSVLDLRKHVGPPGLHVCCTRRIGEAEASVGNRTARTARRIRRVRCDHKSTVRGGASTRLNGAVRVWFRGR